LLPISVCTFLRIRAKQGDANADNSYGSNGTPSLKKPTTTAPVEIQEAQLKKSGRRSNGLGDDSISNTIIITLDKEESRR
jgi:hypothetical protein